MSTPAPLTFELAARARGGARRPRRAASPATRVRLMVAHRSTRPARRTRGSPISPSSSTPATSLVVNTSAHAPGRRGAIAPTASRARAAPLDAELDDGATGSSSLGSPRAPAPTAGRRAPGDRLALPGGASLDLLRAVPRRARLWVGRPRHAVEPAGRPSSPRTAGRSATRTSRRRGRSTRTRTCTAPSPAAPRCRARGGRSRPSVLDRAGGAGRRGHRRSCCTPASSSLEDDERPLPRAVRRPGRPPRASNAARGAADGSSRSAPRSCARSRRAADADGAVHAARRLDRPRHQARARRARGRRPAHRLARARALAPAHARGGRRPRAARAARTRRPRRAATCGTSSATST